MSIGSIPTLEIADGVATITLRRPAQHNRIDPDDPAILSAHIAQVRQSPEARMLVITGEGQRTFCSGYTLGQIGARLDRSLEDMLDALEALEIPTVCAMNGSAYGGGTDLAITCDFRVGVRGCKIFMPAARFGLHYYPGGLRRFVTRLGPTCAKKIFLTSMTLECEELLRVGFLTELVERDQLHQTLQRYKAGVSGCEPQALGSMKRHIDAIAAGDWDEQIGRRAYEGSLRAPETARRLAELTAK